MGLCRAVPKSSCCSLVVLGLAQDPRSNGGGRWVRELGAFLLPTCSSCLLLHQLSRRPEPSLLVWRSSAATFLTDPCCTCSQRWGPQKACGEGQRPSQPFVLPSQFHSHVLPHHIHFSKLYGLHRQCEPWGTPFQTVQAISSSMPCPLFKPTSHSLFQAVRS